MWRIAVVLALNSVDLRTGIQSAIRVLAYLHLLQTIRETGADQTQSFRGHSKLCQITRKYIYNFCVGIFFPAFVPHLTRIATCYMFNYLMLTTNPGPFQLQQPECASYRNYANLIQLR